MEQVQLIFHHKVQQSWNFYDWDKSFNCDSLHSEVHLPHTFNSFYVSSPDKLSECDCSVSDRNYMMGFKIIFLVL